MGNEKYLPVPWDFRESIEEAMEMRKSGPIHFFVSDEKIDTGAGAIVGVEKNDNGEFLILSNSERIRLDKIITLYGKPGPAYDQYDAFANACLDCTGGYDIKVLNI